MTCRIVTEGVTDEIILKALLASHVPASAFAITSAGGFSPAIALARTLLLKGQSGIVLIVDANAVTEAEVRNKRLLADRTLVPYDPNRYRLFMAIPSIEAWLFLDAKVTVSLLGSNAPPSMIANAPRHPKVILRNTLMRRYRRPDLTALQKLLNESDLRPIASHQPVLGLVEFIRDVTLRPPARSIS